MAERFRVLGLPDVNAVRPPAKVPTIRSAVGNPGSGALSRGKFRSTGGESSFNVASRKFSNLGPPVEFHAPPVITREEQVAREMQEHEISAVAAQDKTEAASARFAQAISHADVTDFAQISSDAQPRPTSKTLVTRSSPPVPNARYYAQFPEKDDPDTCPNICVSAPRYPNSHDGFTSGNLSAEVTRLQDEATLRRQRFLPERDSGNACCRGPSRAVLLQACRGLRGREGQGQPGLETCP